MNADIDIKGLYIWVDWLTEYGLTSAPTQYRLHTCTYGNNTILYDTIEEFNVDSKADYTAKSSTFSQKLKQTKQCPFNSVQTLHTQLYKLTSTARHFWHNRLLPVYSSQVES